MVEISNDIVLVPEDLGAMLVRLSEGWTPLPFVPGTIESLSCNGIDVTETARRLRLEAGSLVAVLDGPKVQRQRHEEGFPTLDVKLEGDLVEGVRFRAQMASRISYGADLVIELTSWAILPTDVPSLWIGEIEGLPRLSFGGNLIAERVRQDLPSAGGRCHFRLIGEYTYYLVHARPLGDAPWHLLIDTSAGVPETTALARDFLALQFAFGCELRIETFVGVRSDGETVAAVGGVGLRKHLHARATPPVPIERNNVSWVHECWVAVLFERLCVAMRGDASMRAAYDMAIDSYLDSTTNHLDSDYLRLQVALEAFSYWALRSANGSEEAVVKDPAQWKAWVKAHATEIRGFASDGFADSLLNKVMGLYRLSSGRVVATALHLRGLVPTPQLTTELEARDTIVHQGLMAPDGYDVERDLDRVAVVRSALVALVAKSIDYGGAINGWSRGAHGHPEEPGAWWHVRESDRVIALRNFAARVRS